RGARVKTAGGATATEADDMSIESGDTGSGGGGLDDNGRGYGGFSDEGDDGKLYFCQLDAFLPVRFLLLFCSATYYCCSLFLFFLLLLLSAVIVFNALLGVFRGAFLCRHVRQS
ncbi:unnamed protein product, partial [Pylaiella littoralis]